MYQKIITLDSTIPYVICVMCVGRKESSQQNYEVYDSMRNIAALRAQNVPPKVLIYE